MTFTSQNLDPLVRGDDWTIKLTLTSGGSPIDITGYTFYFTLKSDIDVADVSAELQVTATSGSPDAANGIVYIVVDNTDTYSLDPRTYNYDVQQTDDVGNVTTILIGKVKVEKDVTRTTGTSP